MTHGFVWPKGASLRNSHLGSAAMLASVFALAHHPTAAHAQELESASDPEQNSLNTIVVTARRKEEALQDVPVTVTSVGSETLETFAVTNVDKIVSRVPTLNIQQGGANGGASLSLRGVGTANVSAAFDSAVALDFDGVQIGQLRILQAGFFDLEQVDLLKGPQSLYFGKSASAGVLSFRSAGPTDTWELGTRLTYETEERGYAAEAYVSGPLTDTLGVRLAGRFSQIDQIVVNEFPGVANPERESQDIYLRGTLRWEPSADFTADLRVNYISNERDGAFLFQEIDCGPNGVADDVTLLGGGLNLAAGYNCDVGDGRVSIADPAPPIVASLPTPFRSTSVPFHDTEIWFTRLAMDLDLTDRLTLTSVTGQYTLETTELDAVSFGGVLEGVPFGTGLGTPFIANDQFTQEVRLTGSDFGAFSFTLGAFYEYRDFDFDAPLYAVNIGLVGPDPVTGFTTDVLKLQNTKSETFSVFASMEIELMEDLILAGGARYTDESKTSRISVPFQHAFLAGSGAFLPSGFFSGPIDFDDDNISPEVTLRYQLADDISVFAAYKTGFKSGGIDVSALPTASLDVSRQTGDFSDIIFASEESEGFEAGIKSELFGRQLRLNVTAYRYEYSDLQIQLFDPVAIQFNTLNASEITTTGIDADFVWSTPLDGLSLSGALSFLDAEYSADFFPLGPTNDNLRGRASRNAPDFSGNVGFDFEMPVGALKFGLSGNAAYSGAYFVAEESLADPVQDDFVLFDAALFIGSDDDRWRLSLAAVNLTDKLVRTSVTGRPFLTPTGDDTIVSFNRGRQVFAEVSFTF